MAYIGNAPAEAYTNTVKDTFSGNGSTVAFTLSLPSTTNNVRVVVENVIQDPAVAYSVSGTTLTFTSAPPSGTDNIYAVHLGPAVQTVQPPTELSGNFTLTGDLTQTGDYTLTGRVTASELQISNTNALNEILFVGAEYTNIYSETTSGFDVGTTSSSGSSYLRLLTENAERVRVTAAGNVGIGTASPAAPLHVFTTGSEPARFVRDLATDAGLSVQADNSGPILDTIGVHNLRFFTNGGERARIDTSGNLLVGTTSDGSAKVYAPAAANRHGARAGASTSGYVGVWGEHSLNSSTAYVGYFFNAGSGTGLYISNTAAWQSISDARMKEDVRDLNTTERLMQLRPVDYLWKHQATSDEPDRRNLGFIAQEMKEVFPELVSTSPDGMFGVEYTGLIAPLVKAIQDQQAIIDALEARIVSLEGGAA